MVHRGWWQALARVGSSVVAFFAVTILVFIAFYAAPGAQFRRGRALPASDRSLHGYLHYVWRFVRHGDLGHSIYFREAVTTRIFRAVPVTLSLMLGAFVVALLFGLVPLLRPRARLERAAALFALAGISVHPVWLSLVLSWLFGVHWSVLAPQGYCGITSAATGCSGVPHWASHLLLPWLIVGLAGGAFFSLAVRALLQAELEQDYVRAARARGVDERRIVRVHVLPNLAGPLLALCVTNLGVMFSAAVFVETVFGLPGLGNMFRRSLLQHDLPVTAGVVLLATLTVLVLSLAVDLLSLLSLPRRSRAQRLAASRARRVQRELRQRPAEL